MSKDSVRETESLGEELNELIALCNLGEFTEVLSRANALSKVHTTDITLINLIGAANAGLGLLEDAIVAYKRALEISPESSSSHNNLGNAYVAKGDYEAAVTSFSNAIRFDQQNAAAHNNLGNAFKALSRSAEAIECYKHAISINPTMVDAHSNLGTAFRQGGDLVAATANYRRALALNPTHAEANNNLASVMHQQASFDEAVEYFRKALQSRPKYVDAHIGLGSTLVRLGRIDLAIECFQNALRLKPNHAVALSHLLHQRAHICDWRSQTIGPERVVKIGIETDAVEPFRMLSCEDEPGRHLQRAQHYADSHFDASRISSFSNPSIKKDRLCVGYFSADFQNHATMYLAARLFEIHDKENFEFHIYSYGPNVKDEMRGRLRNSSVSFFDVKDLSDSEIADLAKSNGVDVAVDLKGYTRDSRIGIFSSRVAPVQITWLGYPGTLGTEFFDYLIADPVLIPESERKFYAENIIYLPHSYQVNDDKRRISERSFSRVELGLPEAGFVFCCFNSNYKISKREFDIWARVLDRVEDSVLWLLKSNTWAEANLHSEAIKRSIDPKRIVFASFLPTAEHLARHRHADLFLDTFTVNAHTTASDALWAGLPVLTKIGKGFPARVGASLLTAVGLPELVAESEQDYEQIAIDLATNPSRMAALRAKLSVNLGECPLFDSDLFARNIERAFCIAYERFFEGKAPTTFYVPDQSED